MAKPDLIGIVVRDMETALAFYRLLGLDIPPDAGTEPHVEIALENGFRIAWDTIELMESIHPGWGVPDGHRMVLAFKCASPEEVNTLYKQVIGAGHQTHKAPWDAFWDQRYAVVIDPDGNLIDLFASLG